MTWTEDVVTGLENLNGIAPLADIYNELRSIRTEPHPESFDAIIRRTLESNSSDSDAFQEKSDLFYSVDGIGGGVWGLRSSLENTPVAVDAGIPKGVSEPGRQRQETYRVLRDTMLARKLKQLHENKCQLCGESIQLSNDKGYSEAHHIKPLGAPHNGPDTAENIIVLCPNHHVMLDYGIIPIELDRLIMHPKHKLGNAYANYHNQIIWRQQLTSNGVGGINVPLF